MRQNYLIWTRWKEIRGRLEEAKQAKREWSDISSELNRNEQGRKHVMARHDLRNEIILEEI